MSDAITLDMVEVRALVRVMIFALSKGLQGSQEAEALHCVEKPCCGSWQASQRDVCHTACSRCAGRAFLSLARKELGVQQPCKT